jgi:circadian clock protein KaiA
LVAPLQIYILTRGDQAQREASQAPAPPLDLALDPSRYTVQRTTVLADALDWLEKRSVPPDCLVVDGHLWQQSVRDLCQRHSLILPVVVLVPEASPDPDWGAGYGGVVVPLAVALENRLEVAIQTALQQFVRLSEQRPPALDNSSASSQQEQLTDKLKARLGYLGVYYKRNPSFFLRHMSQADRDAYLAQLKADYRVIILAYFASPPKVNLNEAIDNFVNQAFMADISVAQIVEIHMELMDSFSKQLKLEGRSEEILLDYRLTLIDVIAHLCEMYRRSIPREP